MECLLLVLAEKGIVWKTSSLSECKTFLLPTWRFSEAFLLCVNRLLDLPVNGEQWSAGAISEGLGSPNNIDWGSWLQAALADNERSKDLKLLFVLWSLPDLGVGIKYWFFDNTSEYRGGSEHGESMLLLLKNSTSLDKDLGDVQSLELPKLSFVGLWCTWLTLESFPLDETVKYEGLSETNNKTNVYCSWTVAFSNSTVRFVSAKSRHKNRFVRVMTIERPYPRMVSFLGSKAMIQRHHVSFWYTFCILMQKQHQNWLDLGFWT